MGKLCLIDLDGDVYSCKFCEANLALTTDVIYKNFHCKNGEAYFMNKVVNVSHGEKEDKLMMTGMHTVATIYCLGCGCNVGWKYEFAHQPNEKYKENMY